MQARLYYECHITIDPVFESERDSVKKLADVYGFRLAKLLMQKRKEDTPEQSKYDTFMTTHSRDYDDIHYRMACMMKTLTTRGYNVRRAKIEDTLFDTKHGDTVNGK